MINWTKDFPLPKWAEPLLQGVAYWMGYKGQLYWGYPLSEGAIVGESVSFINGNLRPDEKLECEVMYRNLGLVNAGQTRADLVISSGNDIKTVIEVKRAVAADHLVKDDLERLCKYHSHNVNARCFLLLVSQNAMPKVYIDANKGEAQRGNIITTDYTAKVRRACKATGTFKKKTTGSYACLIEVVSRIEHED